MGTKSWCVFSGQIIARETVVTYRTRERTWKTVNRTCTQMREAASQMAEQTRDEKKNSRMKCESDKTSWIFYSFWCCVDFSVAVGCCHGYRPILLFLPIPVLSSAACPRVRRVCMCVLAILLKWKCLYYLRWVDSPVFFSTSAIAARRCLPMSNPIVCRWLCLRAFHRRNACVASVARIHSTSNNTLPASTPKNFVARKPKSTEENALILELKSHIRC